MINSRLMFDGIHEKFKAKMGKIGCNFKFNEVIKEQGRYLKCNFRRFMC